MSLMRKVWWSVPTGPAVLNAGFHPNIGPAGNWVAEKCKVGVVLLLCAPCLLPPTLSIQRAR